ncbi:MAG TPA: hypothetical protein VNQ76_00370 [Planctomicrobium sp.]|nr:hypothetical protein [Planctomicrobium sp.]
MKAVPGTVNRFASTQALWRFLANPSGYPATTGRVGRDHCRLVLLALEHRVVP